MISTEILIDQTLAFRENVVKLLRGIPHEQADTIPPTWRNNAHWHAGHLIVTPCMVTFGILKEPLPVPAEYVKWFAKGSDPSQWGSDVIPSYSDLVDDLIPSVGRLFDSLKDRMDEPFLQPYLTSAGVTLHSVSEALHFSLVHDGLHMGLLMALKRSLDASHAH